ETARRISRHGEPPAARAYALGDFPFLPALWSAGGAVCDARRCRLDAPEALETLRFILSLRDEGFAHPRGLGNPDYAFSLFLRGDVAMTVAPSAYLPRTAGAPFPVGVAPVPGKRGPVSALSDDLIVVFANHAGAKNEAIGRALDALTGPLVLGDEAARLGSAPIRDSAADAAAPPEGLAAAYRCAQAPPLIGPWSAVESELYRYLALAYRWQGGETQAAPVEGGLYPSR
ncbi:MAG: hypothetical protein JXR94_06200, partial [Candidatus Hydrogenedentes bacterium]|nr:hypothetical protein [Candidatus Hydrogenedentota bacterium]